MDKAITLTSVLFVVGGTLCRVVKEFHRVDGVENTGGKCWCL
jgi:hypothetical protein